MFSRDYSEIWSTRPSESTQRRVDRIGNLDLTAVDRPTWLANSHRRSLAASSLTKGRTVAARLGSVSRMNSGARGIQGEPALCMGLVFAWPRVCTASTGTASPTLLGKRIRSTLACVAIGALFRLRIYSGKPRPKIHRKLFDLHGDFLPPIGPAGF